MVVNVGINGFGRIGRIIARACLQNPNLQVTAINDPAIKSEYICYLLKYDSTHGKLNSCVSHKGNVILIDDKPIIKVFHENVPASIPWHTADVHYVIESSGMFTNYDKAAGHLANDSVKRVIVTAPSVDIPMVILGVNECKLTAGQKVMSCASSTLYCLAPIIKILEDNFGVSEGFITSIHAMTPSLKPLDGLCLRGKHWRDHRSIHQNIIPAATGACKALGKIIPQLKDKLTGLAFRVPIVNVSVLDLSIRLRINTTLQEIVKTVERASQYNMSNIIKVTNEVLVSSDFMAEQCSCMFDSNCSIQLKPNFYKIICWYENEHSYACRVIDSIFFSEKQFFHLEFPSKVTNARLKYVCKRDEILQTDSSYLQASVSVHCDFEIVANTSSDTYASNARRKKSSTRQTYMNKPVISETFPVCKKPVNTECFKIWNDSDITRPAVRQNRGSFFQSYAAFSPQVLNQISNCATTQERLANVKKEFSKMVNITEDLLKKTHSSQSQNKVLGKDEVKLNVVTSLVDNNKSYDPLKPHADPSGDFEDIKINQLQNKSSHKDSLNKLSPAPKLNEIKEPDIEIDLCGDFKDNKQSDINSTLELKNTKLDDELKPIEYSASLQKNKTEEEFICFNVDNDAPESSLNSQIEIEELTNESLKITRADYDCGDKVSNVTDLNKCLADTVVNTLIDGFHQTFEVHCASLTTEENTFIENIPDTDQNDTKQPLNNDSDNITESVIVSEPLKSENEKSLCEQFKSFENVKLIDEELKKRNIELIEYPFIAEIDSKAVITNQSLEIKPTTPSKKENLCKVTFEGLDDAFPTKTDISSDYESRCSRSKNVVIPKNNGDIYDKLDSASGSDSNNSFDIHVKKSQIIQITDVTNSLEDLERLDKICRIIEISDELSDQLFSPLNDTGVPSSEKEKWSFKDLCAKIKLDEFCNKVFGHITT